MSAIDCHAHVIVPELLRESGPHEAWRPRVSRDDAGQLIELGGRRIRSAVSEFVDLEAILADRERVGIDRVLLCPWVPLLFGGLEAGAAAERLRLQNEGLARMRAAAPERVAVLGGVPLQDPELAAVELQALMESGAFAGVEVTASVGGVYLGDARFEPFWAQAERSGALVFVHPTTRGFTAPVFGEHYLWNLVGNPMETTIAAAHIVLSAVLERHPSLRVLLAHAGGALPALRGRLRHGATAVDAAGSALREPVQSSLTRLWVDTITHDPAALRAVVEAAGAEHVLLGSDYPFDMADPDPVATVRAAGLGDAAERAVIRGNAERLLGFGAAVAR